MKKIIIASALMLAATTSSFGAVKAGKFGMDFMYAGAIGQWQTKGATGPGVPDFAGMPGVGFRYHITDMIAVAPSLGFYTATGTDNSANGDKSEYTSSGWGLGLEIPIYLLKLNALDFYVAPGIGYNSIGTTVKNTFANGNPTTESGTTGNHLSLFAAIGLQIPINDQLHVFGKTTVGYASGTTNPNTKANPSQPDDKSTYFGIQSWAVGAIFYFN